MEFVVKQTSKYFEAARIKISCHMNLRKKNQQQQSTLRYSRFAPGKTHIRGHKM